MPLALLGILGLIETIYLGSYLLIFDFSLAVDLYLEQLHPADAPNGVLRQHPCDQILQEGRNRPRKLELFAVEHFNQVGNRIGLKRAHPINHLKQHHP